MSIYSDPSTASIIREQSHIQPDWPCPPDRDLIDRLRSQASGEFRIVFLAMADSGIRVNELRRLVWRDVDLSRQIILTDRQGKLARRGREVPIENDLATCLAQYRSNSRFNGPEDCVLSTISGRPWAHILFSRQWQKLCRLVVAEYDLTMPGTDFFPLSHLRRNAVRRWREQGVSYAEICRWMGRYHALTGAFARDSFATK